ncbi:unnamed protein product [Mytilus coruscus]|uniref:Uncharacterized protein n=1 Tax=Mytilus coruscus TaxID=42192 RepID=A0A6J8BTU2_MYTCO|nr:unnamed protein product [Mytilus coruscus]
MCNKPKLKGICTSLIVCTLLFWPIYQILLFEGSHHTRLNDTPMKTTPTELHRKPDSLRNIIPDELSVKTTSAELHRKSDSLRNIIPNELSVKTTPTELHRKSDSLRNIIPDEFSVKTTSTQLHRKPDSLRNIIPDKLLVKTIPTELHRKPDSLGSIIPDDLTFVDNKWKLSDLCKPYKTFLNDSDFFLIRYTSNAGIVNIFTHSLRDGISSMISREGAFELKTINRILYQLQQDPNMNLIGIGTNIGQHCIAAALIGRDSIAIDAAKSNIEHVCVSAHYLNIGSRITLIHTILSDSNGKREFRYSASKSDFGSINVDSDGIWEKMKKQYNTYFSLKTVEENSATLQMGAVLTCTAS